MVPDQLTPVLSGALIRRCAPKTCKTTTGRIISSNIFLANTLPTPPLLSKPYPQDFRRTLHPCKTSTHYTFTAPATPVRTPTEKASTGLAPSKHPKPRLAPPSPLLLKTCFTYLTGPARPSLPFCFHIRQNCNFYRSNQTALSLSFYKEETAEINFRPYGCQVPGIQFSFECFGRGNWNYFVHCRWRGSDFFPIRIPSIFLEWCLGQCWSTRQHSAPFTRHTSPPHTICDYVDGYSSSLHRNGDSFPNPPLRYVYIQNG